MAIGVKPLARALRSHRGMENGCHWVLDVTYREDGSRIWGRLLQPNVAWLTATSALPADANTARFEQYVTKMLGLELKPDDVVIWDNSKPRKSEEAVEAVGAEVVPLPPWGPDLMPIDEMVPKVKNALRSARARTTEVVYEAFGWALHDVTPENSVGRFQDRAADAMQRSGAQVSAGPGRAARTCVIGAVRATLNGLNNGAGGMLAVRPAVPVPEPALRPAPRRV